MLAHTIGGKKIKTTILKMFANPGAYQHPGQTKLTKGRISKSQNQPLSSSNIRAGTQLAWSSITTLSPLGGCSGSGTMGFSCNTFPVSSLVISRDPRHTWMGLGFRWV